MKPYIVTEGRFDKELLARLLDDLVATHPFIIEAANGRDNARPLARRRLLVERVPVVFAIDSDSLEVDRVEGQRRDFENYLAWGGHGIPFKVILFIPTIDVIFFDERGPLERLLGHELDEAFKVAGKVAPAAILHSLLGQMKLSDYLELPSQLNDRDLVELRRHPTIHELREFIRTYGRLKMAAG